MICKKLTIMSILTSTSTGKNSVLDIYFFDKLGMIKCGGLSFNKRQNIPGIAVFAGQNEYLQAIYTLGAVFIYMNDKNEFFYRGGKSTGDSLVKILSRNHLFEMIKTDMEYEEKVLSKTERTSSYTLDCYEKIYNRLKKLI